MKKLPQLERLTEPQHNSDLFICAMGFEERCTIGSRRLEKLGYKCKHSIMLKYDLHEEDNMSNEPVLLKILENISESPFIISNYHVTDTHKSESNFIQAINIVLQQTKVSLVTIDITSFSSTAIIQILDLLVENCKEYLKEMRIIYTEAKTYFPLRKDSKKAKIIPEAVYLSSGVREIIIIPRFNGIFYPGYSTLLVIFLGFEPIRARGAITFLQPSKKIGIVGVPPRKSRSWRAKEVGKRNQRIFDDKDQTFELSTFYYDQTVTKLEEIYKTFSPASNISICPIGSKLQTLGVFLFARNHPDVKLLIPIPMEFHPKRYSKGYTKTWQIVFEEIENANASL